MPRHGGDIHRMEMRWDKVKQEGAHFHPAIRQHVSRSFQGKVFVPPPVVFRPSSRVIGRPSRPVVVLDYQFVNIEQFQSWPQKSRVSLSCLDFPNSSELLFKFRWIHLVNKLFTSWNTSASNHPEGKLSFR